VRGKADSAAPGQKALFQGLRRLAQIAAKFHDFQLEIPLNPQRQFQSKTPYFKPTQNSITANYG
jgi:hypothetical protein